jgi:hypothetical protein
VSRNVKSATQFSGSAIVNRPIGGRKKKLKQSIATTDTAADTRKPEVVAVPRTTVRSRKPTVDALTVRR